MHSITRRGLLLGVPAIIRAESALPKTQWGVQSGDVQPGRAMIWSKTDRPARMVVTYSTSEHSTRKHRVMGPICRPETDFTGRVELTGLAPGQQIVYSVQFEDIGSPKIVSPAIEGHFRTPPGAEGNVKFLWSGDTVGQGWGINPDFG